MSGLKQQIEKKAFGVLDVSKSIRVNRQVVYLKDVLGLLADYRCIPTKQLEEHRDRLVKERKKQLYPYTNVDCLILNAGIALLTELLEESKKKE